MKKYAVVIVMMMFISTFAMLAQSKTHQITPVTGYIIDGQFHYSNCECDICKEIRSKNNIEKDTPPPAPKDPEDKSSTAVKSDSNKTIARIPSKEEIVKSIQDNQQIPQHTKKEILNNLSETKKESPKNTSKFNLLEALEQKNRQPAVKTYSEETPKPKEIQAPLGMAQSDYEAPNTNIGMSIGGKIDYSTPWDPSKPVPYGKILQFWVKPVTKRPDKLKNVAYNWTVLPNEDVVTWPDTTRIITNSGTKQQNYIIILTASYVFVDGDKIIQKTNQATLTFQVGSNIQPPVGKIPSNPTPDLNGITKQAFEWVNEVIRNDNYTDQMVKVDAAKLANVFVKIAAKIDGSQLVDAADILQTTKTENDNAIQNNAEWMPWFTKMSDLLRAGFKNNTIRTPQQYKEVWLQIAKGLEAAAN